MRFPFALFAQKRGGMFSKLLSFGRMSSKRFVAAMNRFTLRSPSGASLNVGFREAETNDPASVRGTVLIFHGLAEHSARYASLADLLAGRGFDVYAHDHRGHGKTEAPDAPLRRFAKTNGAEAVLADCRAVHEHALARHPDKPIVVLGHSMGGLIALNYAERFGSELAGVAVWNANFRTRAAERIGRLAMKVEKALKGSDVPSALLQRATFDAWAKSVSPRRTQFDWLSHDAAAVDAYISDPLCCFSPTLSMMEDILALVFHGGSQAGLDALPAGLPVHLLGGGQDPATDNAQGVRWLDRRLRETGHKDVTLTIVEGARHETLNEIESYRSQAISALTAWLDRIMNSSLH